MALFPTYNRFPLHVKEAKGTVVTDTNNKKYLDFGSGIGVVNLGHRHEKVQQSVENQLNLYWHSSNLYHNPIQEIVAEKITTHSQSGYVFFCNSGAEANEAAIKLARKITGKNTIITFQQSFHGRTFATMAATGQPKVREGYGEMLKNFTYATYNDIDSVKALLHEDIAGIMIELVQGEGGVHPIDETFLYELKKLCEDNHILFMVDEIQTGIGRTGKKYSFDHYDIKPDIFTLAKGLGNGLPIGAMVAKEEYKDSFQAGSHGSTFGGNPIAMSAANAVLDTVFDELFLEEVNEKANYLGQQLRLHLEESPEVIEIRQKGMMVGIECTKNVSPLISALLKEGLLVLNAGENVLRLLPPLTVKETEIDQAVDLIAKAFTKF